MNYTPLTLDNGVSDHGTPTPFGGPHKRTFPWMRLIAVSTGIVIGVPMMLIGFVRVQNSFFTRASDTYPNDVVVHEISATTAKIQWYTDQESQGIIMYGTVPTSLSKFAPEQGPGKDHTLKIEGLSPQTRYYFSIKIGSNDFLDGAVPWQFRTIQ
jgi:hypothetical protein